jgi:hypothetical protein
VLFEIIGEIEHIETIATGGNIHDIMRLQKQFGPGKWKKLKGIGTIKIRSGNIHKAELHWYEAHGIGKKKMKIKKLLT